MVELTTFGCVPFDRYYHSIVITQCYFNKKFQERKKMLLSIFYSILYPITDRLAITHYKLRYRK